MLLGQLTTIPIEDHAAEQTEIGQFTLEVNLPEKAFLQSRDKPGLVKSTIAQHLASAIMDTEVPKDYWAFQAAPVLRKEFNFPQVISFGG